MCSTAGQAEQTADCQTDQGTRQSVVFQLNSEVLLGRSLGQFAHVVVTHDGTHHSPSLQHSQVAFLFGSSVTVTSIGILQKPSLAMTSPKPGPRRGLRTTTTKIATRDHSLRQSPKIPRALPVTHHQLRKHPIARERHPSWILDFRLASCLFP